MCKNVFQNFEWEKNFWSFPANPIKFEIKHLNYGGICFCEKSSDRLIDLGNIVLKKQNWKKESFCFQHESNFDYHGFGNALSGKTGYYNNFTPKRILVIQMK